MAVERPLLETKLYLPQWTASAVSRQRLIARIQQTRKLTLISAPAGFGKTTLLTEWAASAPMTERVAWLSLDQSDNNPALFWTYLITALQKIQPKIGDRALTLLQSSQSLSIESILVILINEISAIKAPLALVLDDYHVIETQAIHSALNFLLSHLPSQLHLIIASRCDPPWPLARLRASQDLIELRAADLRFTPDEAATFLNQIMRLELSAADISALEQRTEGWITGLQLAALSMQGRKDTSRFITAFSGNDRYIIDYLLEEVLKRQSDRTRHFLLQTAFLDRLNSSLCNAVTHQTDAQEILETLERDNLFIVPLDNKRQWYRYHHLFADVLLARATAELSEQILKLHSRASKWCEQHKLFPQAIHHALSAQAFEKAADLIEQEWPAMRRQQQESTVRSWMTQLPDEIISDRPILSAAYGVVLLTAGQIESVENHLKNAEQKLTQLNKTISSGVADSQLIQQFELKEEQYRALPASIANIRAFRAQALGDFASTITYAQQALSLLPANDNNERGVTASFLALAYWANGDVKAAYQSFAEGLKIFQKLGDVQIVLAGTSVLAYIAIAQGRMRSAAKACESALKLATQQDEPILQGTADLHLALSEIRYEQGDLEAANQLLSKGESLRKQGAISGADYLWWVMKAQLETIKGNLETACDHLEKAEGLYRRSPIPNVRPIEALRARLWLRQRKLPEALNWVKSSGLSLSDPPNYLREYEHLTIASILIVQHRQDSQKQEHNRDRTDKTIQQVLNLLSRLLSAAEEKERTISIIKILLVLALAKDAKGDVEDAIALLKRALTLAEPEGYIHVFVEHEAPMIKLLQQAVVRGIAPTYSRHLLAVLKSQQQLQNQSSAQSATPSSQPLIDPLIDPPIDPLSQRELDVLRLLNTERSGPEIAQELVIALSTVRTHTKRIYSKLNVTSRRAAIKRAAELDLL